MLESVERLGKYEIRGVLGTGATATVYLGFDAFAQREVAIKLIKPEVLKDRQRGSQYRRMLLNEASLAGKLQHPHIVQIHDAVVDEEHSYIVMEVVAGGTLEPFTRADKLLPVERVVEIVFKCSRALDYASQHGVIHRDIKPANILLAGAATSETGAAVSDIKISDFGAALYIDSESTQVSGVGSPAYMSPQQVQDLPVDQQTDIYALGVVMYQLLTGQLPFKAANHYAMVYQILNAEVIAPSLLRAVVPAALDAVVLRAMARDTRQRYASWGEFAQDLAQVFRDQRLQRREAAFPDSEKFETLRALPFFHNFSAVELWEVVRFARWQALAAETCIMQEGEVGDCFCFLIEGEVRVVKQGQLLNYLQVGECFGEMALINREQALRGADVITSSAAKIISIPAQALQQASDACRMHVYEAFLQVLSRRLDAANLRLADV